MAQLAVLATLYGQKKAGDAAEDAGKQTARELERRAAALRAAGTREAAEEQRNAEVAYSRALAVAAASVKTTQRKSSSTENPAIDRKQEGAGISLIYSVNLGGGQPMLRDLPI